METIIQKQNKNLPCKVTVLCGDAPQHFFLIRQLIARFNVVGIIIECDKAQMATLLKKGKYKLWRFRKYHKLRRRLYGYDRARKHFFANGINIKWQELDTIHVQDINDQQVIDQLDEWGSDLTICYGTMYIKKKVRTACKVLINIHTGILPYYKGNQCIFFALYHDEYDKVGATLHLVTEKLDGGAILAIVKPPITAEDNEETLYAKSAEAGINGLVDIIKAFDNGETIRAHHQPDIGKTYQHENRTLWVEIKYKLKKNKTSKLIF